MKCNNINLRYNNLKGVYNKLNFFQKRNKKEFHFKKMHNNCVHVILKY